VTCSVKEGSLPLFFTWHKDNQVIADTNIKILSMSERISTLIIEKVSANDSGNYTCNVRNAFGSDEHTISLIIKGIDEINLLYLSLTNSYKSILVALRWTSIPSDLTVSYGQRIDIKCAAEGNPKPKIEWYKLNDRDESSKRITSFYRNNF
jgi:Immunoglobulin I-set domain